MKDMAQNQKIMQRVLIQGFCGESNANFPNENTNIGSTGNRGNNVEIVKEIIGEFNSIKDKLDNIDQRAKIAIEKKHSFEKSAPNFQPGEKQGIKLDIEQNPDDFLLNHDTFNRNKDDGYVASEKGFVIDTPIQSSGASNLNSQVIDGAFECDLEVPVRSGSQSQDFFDIEDLSKKKSNNDSFVGDLFVADKNIDIDLGLDDSQSILQKENSDSIENKQQEPEVTPSEKEIPALKNDISFEKTEDRLIQTTCNPQSEHTIQNENFTQSEKNTINFSNKTISKDSYKITNLSFNDQTSKGLNEDIDHYNLDSELKILINDRKSVPKNIGPFVFEAGSSEEFKNIN